MSEKLSDAHRRVEDVGSRLEHGELQQQMSAQTLQSSTERRQHDINQVSKFVVETQTDFQLRRDQRIEDQSAWASRMP